MDSSPQAQHGQQRSQKHWFNLVSGRQGTTRMCGFDGGKYYRMLFVYVDDILELSHKTTEVITEITSFYKGKGREYRTTGYLSRCKY